MTARRYPDDRGMVVVWTVVVVMACLLMTGLVLDGGAVLRSRSRTFDIAGAAARVGVQELDPYALTEGRVELDQGAAQRVAEGYLSVHNVGGEVTVSSLEVQVTIHDSVQLQILRPTTISVTETATARAEKGTG